MQLNLYKKIVKIGFATNNIYNIILVEVEKMKFCDKLARQRKNNNLSQEQLADRLGVSRQAVSKWELGASYPDMEKIIQLTKILNCTLEDLLDDGTINSNTQTTKINLNNCMQEMLSFITKTYNMFCSMTLKEKLKCLFEMFILGLILLIVFSVATAIINELILGWMWTIPKIGETLIGILNNLIIIIFIALALIIFIHIFKIRYLDYFITIEDSNSTDKTIEEPVDEKGYKKYKYEEKQKEKIIIRDPKHSIMNFSKFLMKIVILILKFFALIFIVPMICIFIFLIILTVISLYHTIYATLFLFIGLSVAGGVLISYIIIEVLYNFIVNRETNFKKVFIIFITSFIMIGLFSGMSFVSIMNYDYQSDLSDLNKNTLTKYIEIGEKTFLLNHVNTEYIVDNNVTDNSAKVEITSIKELECNLRHFNIDGYDYYDIETNDIDMFKIYKIVRKDFQNKKIRNYTGDNLISTKVYLSEATYNFLKENNRI